MNFLRTCIFSVATVALPFSVSAQTVSCDLMSNLKSYDSGIAIDIKFANASENFHHIDWIDYQGQFVNYNALSGGESYVQSTFVGHPWIITDGPGNCIAIFIPRPGDTRFTIPN